MADAGAGGRRSGRDRGLDRSVATKEPPARRARRRRLHAPPAGDDRAAVIHADVPDGPADLAATTPAFVPQCRPAVVHEVTSIGDHKKCPRFIDVLSMSKAR